MSENDLGAIGQFPDQQSVPVQPRTQHPRAERISQIRREINKKLPEAQKVVQKFPLSTRDPRQTIHIAADLARRQIEQDEREDTDPMTGLLSREGFRKRLSEKVEDAKRSDRQIAIILFDMNGMGEINKRLGLQAGDFAVHVMATVLQQSFREVDLIGRRGEKSDEFVAAVSINNPDELRDLYARFSNNLSLVKQDLPGMNITAPAGAAIMEEGNYQEAEARADFAMQEAKIRSKENNMSAMKVA